MQKEEYPIKICHVGGREFRIYREFDERVQMWYLTYPLFGEQPEYTSDGRPFTRSDQTGCPLYKPEASDDASGECGECVWFRREETPADVVGVCMCEELRHEKKNINNF